MWRYYGVGVVNTAFGYSIFAALVWAHLNVFVAQISAHIVGMAFNYFMFRRLVFTSSRPAILRYVGSYAVNYLISLGFLAVFHLFVRSSYAAGFLALLATSMLNYLMLKFFVFHHKATTS